MPVLNVSQLPRETESPSSLSSDFSPKVGIEKMKSEVVLMVLIFRFNPMYRMVSVKALVFKPSPKKKRGGPKGPRSEDSIKIPVLTQKDKISNISRKGNLQNLQFYLLPQLLLPSPARQMWWRQSIGGGGNTAFHVSVLTLGSLSSSQPIG